MAVGTPVGEAKYVGETVVEGEEDATGMEGEAAGGTATVVGAGAEEGGMVDGEDEQDDIAAINGITRITAIINIWELAFILFILDLLNKLYTNFFN